jgi:hypothetical protein
MRAPLQRSRLWLPVVHAFVGSVTQSAAQLIAVSPQVHAPSPQDALDTPPVHMPVMLRVSPVVQALPSSHDIPVRSMSTQLPALQRGSAHARSGPHAIPSGRGVVTHIPVAGLHAALRQEVMNAAQSTPAQRSAEAASFPASTMGVKAS